MYYLYEKRCTDDHVEYRRLGETKLWGCKSGRVVQLVRERIAPHAQSMEPVRWHLGESDLCSGGQCLVLDMMPKAPELLFCELTDVWGYSEKGWTPILLRLMPILNFAPRLSADATRIVVAGSRAYDVIYTILRLAGSMTTSGLTGTWNVPGPGATNSALLWPGVLRYFRDCVKDRDSHILT